jgi:hypothetical protein
MVLARRRNMEILAANSRNIRSMVVVRHRVLRQGRLACMVTQMVHKTNRRKDFLASCLGRTGRNNILSNISNPINNSLIQLRMALHLVGTMANSSSMHSQVENPELVQEVLQHLVLEEDFWVVCCLKRL